MLTPAGLLVGFAFKASALDESTTYVVNVCGHDSVGLPLARSMDAVDETYIEHNGIDNLIVPIAVGEPQQASSAMCDYCVDVVVHTVIIRKCTPSHHLFRHLTEKLVTLAIEWVQKECGVQLLPKSCQILGNPLYYTDVKSTAKSFEDVLKATAELLQKQQKSSEQSEEAAQHIPAALNLKSGEAKTKAKPLVQEIITSPGIKKGFLTGGGARLYGPEGSSEGTGKTPDPLAHIPESLRNKCQIIDTRTLAPQNDAHKPNQGHHESSPSSCPPPKHGVPENLSEHASAKRWEQMSCERVENTLTLRFAVPESVKRLQDVELSATEHALEIDGGIIQLPVAVVPDEVRAKFVKATRVLVVTCTVDV